MIVDTDFDIRTEADRVIALLRAERIEEALVSLERSRAGQPPVVQESLDRFVAAGTREMLVNSRQVPDGQRARDIAGVFDRLRMALDAPRFPVENGEAEGTHELRGLTEAQRFDVYASIVETRGNQAARTALHGEERMILGLRRENSTLATMQRRVPESLRIDDPATAQDESRGGTGVYDDRIIVLWRDSDGTRRMDHFDYANTEPTAQYDHHAGSRGRRPFADGSVERRQIAPSTGFGDIAHPRKIEGEDVDGDGLRDLGRLAEGTIEMRMGRHPKPGGHGLREHALQPTAEAVRSGRGRVQRDTNADGWFTTADIGGIDDLNASFKIHRGSSTNTDSAGCQTIRFDDYERFLRVVEGNPHQTRWQYVLTSTTPGMFRNVTHDAPVAPGERADNAPAQGREGRVPRHEGDGGPARPGDAIAPGHPDARDPRDLRDPRDPRHPGHPDHADYRRTHELLREAGARNGIGFDEAGLQRATLGLMAQARFDPTVRRIDEVAFSGATQMHPAGHFVAAIHRPHGEREPAFAVRLETQALLQRPVEEALRQLGDGERQACEQGLALEPAAQYQREALVRTI